MFDLFKVHLAEIKNGNKNVLKGQDGQRVNELSKQNNDKHIQRFSLTQFRPQFPQM